MNTVFVVQRPAYFDKYRRGWVNKYDLTPATKYGELIFLIKPGNIYADNMKAVMRELHKSLADYKPTDHILAIGDPVAIAATVMVAASITGGEISLLKFDRHESQYYPYLINIKDNNGSF